MTQNKKIDLVDISEKSWHERTLSELSAEDIANIRAAKGRYHDTNRPIDGRGDLMNILVAGAEKFSTLVAPNPGEGNE